MKLLKTALFLLVMAATLLSACAPAVAPGVTNPKADAPGGGGFVGTPPTPTPVSLPTAAPSLSAEAPAEVRSLPLGVSSLIGGLLLALAYWLNKRSSAKKPQQ